MEVHIVAVSNFFRCDNLCELFSILNTIQFLEKAYTKDYISAEKYSPFIPYMLISCSFVRMYIYAIRVQPRVHFGCNICMCIGGHFNWPPLSPPPAP